MSSRNDRIRVTSTIRSEECPKGQTETTEYGANRMIKGNKTFVFYDEPEQEGGGLIAVRVVIEENPGQPPVATIRRSGTNVEYLLTFVQGETTQSFYKSMLGKMNVEVITKTCSYRDNCLRLAYRLSLGGSSVGDFEVELTIY